MLGIYTLLKRITPYPLRTRIKGVVYDLTFYQIPRLKYSFKKLTGVNKRPSQNNPRRETAAPEKIKILYVVPCLLVGGAEIMLYQLLRHLDRTKFAVYTVCTHARGELADRVEQSVDGFYDLSLSHQTEGGKNKEILQIIDRHRIDIVHFSNSEALFFLSFTLKLKRPRIRIMNWVHCDILFFDRLYHYAYKRFGQTIDHTIVVNQHMRQYLINQKQVKPDRVTTVLNGIDLDMFSADGSGGKGLRRQYGISDDRMVVSFVARLSIEKNPVQFVRIAARLHKFFPQTLFIIAGDGDLRRNVEKEIAKHNLQSVFLLLGFVNKVSEILAMTDLFISCSLTEGLPINILEAMAMGVPVIAHAVGGVGELIKDGHNGFTVSQIDAELYSEKANQLIKDENLRAQISKKARQTVRANYDIRKTAEKMMAVYSKIMTAPLADFP